jgi:16S rRNA (adenine1518-N6/adenine1519-N6)-dimethyltransferase
VGPGLGAMSHMVVPSCRRFTGFEIDRGFISFLEEHFGSYPRFRIIEGDVIKTWKGAWESDDPPDLIFGNLPYNCAAKLIGDLIEAGTGGGEAGGPRRMLFTVQREVAQRMAASPGDAAFGAFSLLCALSWDVTITGIMKPGAFYPAPEVTSALVVFNPKSEDGDDTLPSAALPVAAALIHDLFLARRKRIHNSVSGGILERRIGREALLKLLKRSGIDTDLRGEELDLNMIKKVVVYLTDEFGFNILG